jgi:DNA-binding LacI/PurR family transcriptional regulator
MLSPERRDQLLDHLRSNGSTRITELVGVLGVSDVTVRRDVDALEREGLVRRFHGGVTLARADAPDPGGEPDTAAGFRLGVLMPGNSYYRRVLTGAKEAAASSGAQLALALLRYDPEPDLAVLQTLLRDGIDGLLFTPTADMRKHPGFADQLRSLPVPVVLIERKLDAARLADRLDHVVSNHHSGARLAVEHLAGLGHRRIGLVAKDISPTTPPVSEGYLHAMAALGLAGNALVLSVPQLDQAERHPDQRLGEALTALTGHGATAVLVHGDAEAVTFLQKALARGIRVPRDLAMVSYDDELAALAPVPLTAVAPPKYHLGRAGVSLLIARLREGAARPVHHLTLQPTLAVRDSCGGQAGGRGRRKPV